MAEGTYEAACMRAELLGLERPDEDDFYRHSPKPPTDDKLEAAQFEDISLQNDDLRQATGGFNELNSILSGTQKKINKLKGMYGSLTDLIKNKLGGSKDNMSYSTDPSYVPIDKAATSNAGSGRDPSTKTDLNDQTASQCDKLDSLLAKAESAQYSMGQQNKQMKRFLNK